MLAKNLYPDDFILDLIQSIEDALCFNPRMMGQQHIVKESGEFWVYESAKLIRLPKIRIFFQILDEEREVLLWAASFS